MTNSPAEDIRNLCLTANIIPVFIGKLPATPIKCLTITDNGLGLPPNDRLNLDFCGIDVFSRSTNYADAYGLLRQFNLYFASSVARKINTTSYIGFWRVTENRFLGYNPTNHPIFKTTFKIARSTEEPGNRASI